VVAVVLIGGLTVCALTGTEAWPLSGWKLFSQVRRADQGGWAATAVVDGAEQPFPFARLPRAYHGAEHVLAEFPGMSADRRRAVCGAWADAMRPRPSEIRVYRTVAHTTLDGAPPTVTRTLFTSCAT
jgi:hypothetical protein